MWFGCSDHLGCEECRAAFLPNVWDTEADKIRKKAGPPCATCLPKMYEDNTEALDIYKVCSSQLIIAPMGGAVGMDIMAIKTAMDIYEVEDQKKCLQKVLLVFNEIKKGQK